MSPHTPLLTGDPAATVSAANLLAYASIAVAAAVLFGYLSPRRESRRLRR